MILKFDSNSYDCLENDKMIEYVENDHNLKIKFLSINVQYVLDYIVDIPNKFFYIENLVFRLDLTNSKDVYNKQYSFILKQVSFAEYYFKLIDKFFSMLFKNIDEVKQNFDELRYSDLLVLQEMFVENSKVFLEGAELIKKIGFWEDA